MQVQFSPDFINLYKKADVRIRKEFDRTIKIFEQDPFNSELKNHELQDEFAGLRSINITADYRGIYEDIVEKNGDNLAYFILLGTHKELYETEVFTVQVKFKK
jgi:addiction module RelE/StbE family toxin